MTNSVLFVRRHSAGNTKESSTLRRSQQLRPFCKICYDTGKKEELYNSHFVRATRDPHSPIVCPTLLAMECRYCFARGHTVSKCPKLGAKPEQADRARERQRSRSRTPPCCGDDVASCASSNGFSLLYSEDDADDLETLGASEDSSTVFPFLEGEGRGQGSRLRAESPVGSDNEVSNKTYAAALMALLKTPPKVVRSTNAVGGLDLDNDNHKDDLSRTTSVQFSVGKLLFKYSLPGSWANDSDSDDDDC